MLENDNDIIEQIINTVYSKAKARCINPSGHFDSAGRWYPCDTLFSYRGSIRMPSRSFPYSYLVHCRTRTFISRLIRGHNVRTLDEAMELYTKGGVVAKKLAS